MQGACGVVHLGIYFLSHQIHPSKRQCFYQLISFKIYHLSLDLLDSISGQGISNQTAWLGQLITQEGMKLLIIVLVHKQEYFI